MTTKQENWFLGVFAVVGFIVFAFLGVLLVHDVRYSDRQTQLCQDRGGVYTNQGCFPATQRIRLNGS